MHAYKNLCPCIWKQKENISHTICMCIKKAQWAIFATKIWDERWN